MHVGATFDIYVKFVTRLYDINIERASTTASKNGIFDSSKLTAKRLIDEYSNTVVTLIVKIRNLYAAESTVTEMYVDVKYLR